MMRKILLLSLFLFSFFTHAAFAEIDQIVFINSPQTIISGQSSGQYQIQLQDASGAVQQAPETIYFTLPLSLGTFSSTKGGTAFTASSSIFIATGDSNKYFYFVSTALGTSTISVSAHNKSNTENWQTQQPVYIVSSIATSTNTNDDSDSNATDTATTTDQTDNQATTTATSTATASDIEYISVHSDPEDLSAYQAVPVLELSAGRDRIGYLGTPLLFNAVYQFSSGTNDSDCTFDWSFGDGLSDTGEKISHLYKYAGNYSVVLNGDCDGTDAVSRTNVTILVPHVSIVASSSDSITVGNDGDTEINFGGWSLVSSSSIFIFPKDTIVGAGQSITLSDEDTKIFPTTSAVSFNDPIGESLVVTENSPTEVLPVSSAILASSSFEIISTSTAANISVIQKAVPIAEKKYPHSLAVKKENSAPIQTVISLDAENDSASADSAIQASSSRRFWHTVLDFPSQAFESVFHTFYNF